MNVRTRSAGVILGISAATLALSGEAGAQLGDPLDGGAQVIPPAARTLGSVTVTSDPAGAIVMLDGQGIHLVGRTPWTIRRGLDGVFTLRSRLDAHEAWRRTIFLSPTVDETLHMDLARKTPAKAAFRSIVVPGWGQSYSDRDRSAALYFGSAVAASVYLAVNHVRYEDRLDELQAAWDHYASTEVQSEREERWLAVQDARAIADDAHGDRALAWGILAAVWGVNLLDSLFFFPNAPSPIVSSSHGDTGLFAEPRTDGVDLGLRLGY